MKKSDLVKEIASLSGTTATQTTRVLDALTTTIGKALRDGDQVQLTGLGTFTKVRRQARKGRNPQTGAPMEIKAKNIVKFKPATKIRAKI